MGILRYNCPHCVTENIALNVVWSGTVTTNSQLMALCLRCPKCEFPSAAILLKNDPKPQWQAGHDYPGDPQDMDWSILRLWPEPPKPTIPESLPPDIERIYLQAERNFPIAGNEEAAGTMYRKALDVGLKRIDPSAKGTLAARIQALAANHKLTPDIAEWSDHIRDLGNDAAHEDSPPTPEELDDLRNFTEMVMRYLFSLPELVKARKSKTGS
jgi:Domain of unknown function (DUF4145)